MKKFHYELGFVCGAVTVLQGPYDIAAFTREARKLGLNGECNDEPGNADCFGLCFNIRNGKSVIWVNPKCTKDEQRESVIHELGHFVQNWMRYFGYDDEELRCRILGGLSIKVMRDLKLLTGK